MLSVAEEEKNYPPDIFETMRWRKWKKGTEIIHYAYSFIRMQEIPPPTLH